jgi:hypothetical protein
MAFTATWPREPEQLALLRSEPREQAVRIVDYTRFPRASRDQGARFGFTRDLSASGMCLGVDEAEPVGSLLRVTLRDVDGRPARCAIERVVWCSSARDGRYWLGLELVAEADPLRLDR